MSSQYAPTLSKTVRLINKLPGSSAVRTFPSKSYLEPTRVVFYEKLMLPENHVY